jgi:hypothetical protein
MDDALIVELWRRVWVVLDLVRDKTRGNRPIEDTALSSSLLLVSAALAELVAKLLAARKRPSDWQQGDYSCMMHNTLLAACTILRVQVKRSGATQGACDLLQLPGALGPVKRPDLLHQTALAQRELCHILQAALEQQQQQQALQATLQQHQQLCELSLQLLSWWTTIESLWSGAGAGADASLLQEALALHHPAMELAALLAQTLKTDSCDADFCAVAEVAAR